MFNGKNQGIPGRPIIQPEGTEGDNLYSRSLTMIASRPNTLRDAPTLGLCKRQVVQALVEDPTRLKEFVSNNRRDRPYIKTVLKEVVDKVIKLNEGPSNLGACVHALRDIQEQFCNEPSLREFVKSSANRLSRYLIEEQQEKAYALTPTQVDSLVNAMCRSKSHFHELRYLIEEQQEKGYTLTPTQVDSLVNAMRRAEIHGGFNN